jgi:hypothetical protein
MDSLKIGTYSNLEGVDCHDRTWEDREDNNPCVYYRATVGITKIDSASVQGYYQFYAKTGGKLGSRVKFSAQRCAEPAACE